MILFKISTKPWYDWFLIVKTILFSLIKNPGTIFSTNNQKTKSDFLTSFLSKNVIVTSPSGISFLARPGYEDLARFLFSPIVAKWEPINEIEVTSGQTIIDIGANVGYYSLKFSSLIGDSGKIISLEPDTNTFQVLKQNCDLNNFKNIETLNLAVSDTDGFLTLYRDEKHSGKSSLFTGSNNKDSIRITTKTLDTLLKDRFQNIDFIKIDTEGAELSILKGASNILKITQKILIELHEEILQQNNQDPLEIEKILKDHGFQIRKFPQYWDKKSSQNKIFQSDYLLGEK